jgi:hypothetical protein
MLDRSSCNSVLGHDHIRFALIQSAVADVHDIYQTFFILGFYIGLKEARSGGFSAFHQEVSLQYATD